MLGEIMDATRLRLARTAHRKPWTAEEDARLAAMAQEGEYIGVIAEALGRSREGVRNRAATLGYRVVSSAGRGRRRLG